MIPTMAWVQWRTGWTALLGWSLGLLLLLVGSCASLAGLYDTPEKVRGYAESLSGGAIVMINGDVAGTDTLGGIFANELGFLVAFGVPLMALALVARSTRRDEEAGRLELLLASRVGRLAPLVAAVGLALAALLIVAVGIAGYLIASDITAGRAMLYGASVLTLGAVHVGVTALLAQLLAHHRSVWGAGLAVVVVTYLLRGVGAAQGSWLTWATPLGWYDEVRAFGDPRPWVLALPVVTAAGLVALALALAARRDVGAALLPSRRAPERASALLRSPVGLAIHDHRWPVLGWVVGGVVVMATYGSLSREVLDALASNPDLADYLGGAAGDAALGRVQASFVLLLAMLASALLVQAIGSLRTEESAGRLEMQLVEGRPRLAWLGLQVAVVAVGAVAVLLLGALALGASTAAAVDDPSWTGEALGAAVAYLPVLLAVGGLAVALFGLLPRWRSLAWVVFALGALLAYMGPALDLPDAVVRSSPFAAVGAVPAQDADVTGLVVLSVVGGVLLVAGLAGFRRRDVPTT